MADIKVGDIIKVKDRKDWPKPPGYLLAGSEGDVTSYNPDEGFVAIHLQKTKSGIPAGTTMVFRVENVEKI